MRKSGVIIITILLVMAAGLGLFLYKSYDALFGPPPDPETIVSASLEGIREQNVLVPFTARYVAVVTSSEVRFGLEAKKTLILPGTVRYELDLAALNKDDLKWDEASKTLSITLPPIRVAGPEVEINQMREYRDGEFIMAITDAESRLDAANRKGAIQQIRDQAAAPTPIKLARNAAKSAISASFAMPLRAAGIEAKVVARFDE